MLLKPIRIGQFFFACIFFTTFQLHAQLNVTFGPASAMPENFLGYNGGDVIYEGQPDLDDTNLIRTFGLLHPSTIRYPAGNIGNYWDWQRGWFYEESKLPNGWELPDDYPFITPKSIGLSELKTQVDRNGVQPVHLFNLLTSETHYQAALIYAARGQNIPTNYLELGNEYYRDEPNFLSRFPTAGDYANTCNQFAAIVKGIKKIGSSKIAVAGATDLLYSQPYFHRRNQWNKDLFRYLSSDIDAVTLHHYVGTGLDASVPVSTSNLPTIMESSFKSMDNIAAELAAISAAGKEAWITEYNFTDRKHCAQGTWTHGMYLSALTLAYLGNNTITRLNCHTMVGNAIFGATFNKLTTNLDISFYDAGVSCTNNPTPSDPWELSAMGNSISLVAAAMENSTTKRQLDFSSSVPKLPGGKAALYGWYFDGPLSEQAIILNLDATNRNINFNTNTWNLSGAKYEQVYPGPGGMFQMINGTAVASPGQYQVATTGLISATQTITVRAYSITRIVKYKNNILLKVISDTICSGSTTTLIVQGGTGYIWSGAAVTQLNAEKSVVQFSSTVSTNTTYTVTVTDSRGLTKSASISVVPSPVLTVSLSGTSVCKGSSVNASASIVPGNNNNNRSFLWIPSEEIDNPLAQTVIIKPTKTTTYTLYACNGECWSAQSIFTINVGPVADAGKDTLLCSNALPYTLAALNTVGSANYKWYSGITLLGTSPVAINPASESTYMLIAVDKTNSTCADTDYMNVTPVICCASATSASLTANPGTSLKSFISQIINYASTSGNGTATSSELKNCTAQIVINGNFYADTSYTFTNCGNILFGEKGHIIIIGKKRTLKFDGCTLNAASCNTKMWDGMLIDQNNSKLIVKNCTVKNAETALEAANSGDLEVTNTKLENNYISILIRDFQEGSDFVIHSDTFTYSSLRTPFSGLKPEAFIKLSNVLSINIGNSNQKVNYFNTADYGIESINSNFNVYNCVFNNFGYSSLNPETRGSAIYQTTSMFGNVSGKPLQNHLTYAGTIGGTGTGQKNTFTNCYYGVVTENCNLTASSNVFTNVSRAMKMTGCTNKDLNIQKNKITNTDMGIDVRYCTNSDLTITNDTITVNAMPATGTTYAKFGIRILDDVRTFNFYSITANKIISSGSQAFWMNGKGAATFNQNLVNMNQTTNQACYGIRFENNDAPNINCNSVSGNSTSLQNKAGISLTYCPAANVTCNITDKTSKGFEFLADCNNSKIQANTIKYHNDGFVLGATTQTGSVIGPQPPLNDPNHSSGNFFLGQYIIGSGTNAGKGFFSHAATWSINSNAYGLYLTKKQFMTYSLDLTQVPSVNLSSGTGATNLSGEAKNKAPRVCSLNCPKAAYPTLTYIADITSAEQIATDIYPAGTNDEGTNWAMKINLYRALLKNTSARQSSTILQNYFNSNANTVIGKLVNVEQSIASLYDTSNVMQNDQTFQWNTINSTITQNNSIVTPTTFDTNEKLVNNIYLNSVAREIYSLTTSQKNSLTAIASQCPYVGGPAVFRARALYVLGCDSALYFDDVTCISSGHRYGENESSGLNTTVSIYPNPNNGTFNIQYNLIDFNRAVVQLFSLNGQKVYEKELNNALFTDEINLENVADGIYFFRVMADGTERAHGKISVIR